ncbi:MAG: hypothetical protein ACI9IP_002616 [Arcticibacterium sp.]|jgi:hypothetical protein
MTRLFAHQAPALLGIKADVKMIYLSPSTFKTEFVRDLLTSIFIHHV